MAALRPARWLVREDAAAFESIGGDVIRHRLQRAGVEGGCDPIGAVRTAVERALEVHGGDVPVLGHAGAHPHQHRVPSAMRVEDLFACERALHRAASDHGELSHHDLVRERIRFAAESAAMRCADDADAVHRELEDLRQRAVYVMDDLRRRPQRHLAVHVRGDGTVLLHRQVRVALEEEDVLAHMFRASETSVDVAELEGHELVDVVRPAVVLDPLVLWIGERGVDGHHRLEDFVVDRDGVACGGSDLFVGGRDRGDGITDVAHLLVRLRRMRQCRVRGRSMSSA